MNKLIVFIFLSLSVQIQAQDVSVVKPDPYSGTIRKSYIREWNALYPQNDPNTLMSGNSYEIQQVTQYLDGLSRPLQTVIKQGSLVTGGNSVDIVGSVIYDECGRQVRSYLPFAASDYGGNTSITDGNFKLNPFDQQQRFYSDYNPNSPILGQGESYYYSKIEYEPSPLNRVDRTYGAGSIYAGGSYKGKKMKYWLNTATDGVRIWTVTNSGTPGTFGSYSTTSTYTAGQLYKTVIADENDKQVIEFTDKSGLLILRKVQLTNADDGTGSNHSTWLCTYYVYDDFNRLRAIITPKGVELLNNNVWNINYSNGDILKEQCYRYEYDERGRLIMKKTPGVPETYAVYDVKDRLVMLQDGNLRAQNKWRATLYDNMDRPVMTGLMSYTGSFDALQQEVSTQTATPSNPTIGLQADLILTGGSQSGVKQAMRSISMEGEFETSTNGEFTAEINAGPGGSDGETSIVEGFEVNKNPIPSGSSFEVLTNTFYDDYNWLTNYGSPPLNATRNTAYDVHLLSASNIFPYPQAVTQSAMTRGMITGARTKILGTSDYLCSLHLYDDKGRIIQEQSTNITGGTDILNVQYSYNGQPLMTIQKQEKAGTNAQTSIVATKITYDDLWRATRVEKRLSNTLINGGAMPSNWTLVAGNEYDALGQLKIKKIGTKPSTTDPLEVCVYNYNIYGNLLGMNRGFTKLSSTPGSTSPYFGFDIGYNISSIMDNSTQIGTYANLRYDGNIAGLVWRSVSDKTQRKYDFTYDAANRLTGGDFNQRTTGSFDKAAGVDFSVDNLNYDANGNMASMNQKGLKGSSSSLIDQLSYQYENNSNRLKRIIDGQNDNNSKLGDFKYDAGTKTATDYIYDVNGNLISDQNKKVSSIAYNYLNLPQNITVTGKGVVSYIYDATGGKLKKIITDNSIAGKTITTTTTYIDAFVYETRQTIPADPNMPDYTDRLLTVSHEEGRIRYVPAVGATPASFVYDYFITDHLGNVRMVLTEQQQQDAYPSVNFEDGTTANEQIYYENVNTQITDRPEPFYNSGQNGIKVQLLRKSVQSMGAGKLLKVMAKDKLHVKVDYYIPDVTTDNTGANGLDALLSNLVTLLNASNAPGALKGNGSAITTDLGNNSIFTNFLAPQNSSVSDLMPKAYLNILFFDEQFKFVQQNSQSVQVSVKGSGQTITLITSNAKEAPVNGYVYVYVNNESENLVYFDRLQVTHERGPILEENHYYPYGLKMADISSKAANFLQSSTMPSYGYQGTFAEEVKDFDLNYNEFELRNYDPQIGRWTSADPYDEFPSPYTGMGNDPVNNVDPDGGSIGGITGSIFLDRAIWTVNGAILGGLINGAANGWDRSAILRGMAYGGAAGLGASYVNWSGVGTALGNAGSWIGNQAGGLLQDKGYLLVSLTDQVVGQAQQRVIGYTGGIDPLITNVDLYKAVVSDTKNKNFNFSFTTTRDAFTVTQGNNKSDHYILSNTAFEPKDPNINLFSLLSYSNYPSGYPTPGFKLFQRGVESFPAQSRTASVKMKYRDMADVAKNIYMHVGGWMKYANGTLHLSASEGCFGICQVNNSPTNVSNNYVTTVVNKILKQAKGRKMILKITKRNNIPDNIILNK